jgi:hypothetical protein
MVSPLTESLRKTDFPEPIVLLPAAVRRAESRLCLVEAVGHSILRTVRQAAL